MQQIDVRRMADSVLREYGVPLTVSAISPASAGWTIAFAGAHPGSPSIEVSLSCDRSSPYHVRESLKKSLDVSD